MAGFLAQLPGLTHFAKCYKQVSVIKDCHKQSHAEQVNKQNKTHNQTKKSTQTQKKKRKRKNKKRFNENEKQTKQKKNVTTLAIDQNMCGYYENMDGIMMYQWHFKIKKKNKKDIPGSKTIAVQKFRVTTSDPHTVEKPLYNFNNPPYRNDNVYEQQMEQQQIMEQMQQQQQMMHQKQMGYNMPMQRQMVVSIFLFFIFIFIFFFF